jgi:hypothetical protein
VTGGGTLGLGFGGCDGKQAAKLTKSSSTAANGKNLR